MVAEKKKTKKPVSYKAKVGCWNCDAIYEISIKIGQVTSQFIHDKNITCNLCKCETLKMYKEYKIDNKIMKDIILHDRLEHMGKDDKAKENFDHYK